MKEKWLIYSWISKRKLKAIVCPYMLIIAEVLSKALVKPYHTEKQLVRVYTILQILLTHIITSFFDFFFFVCLFLFLFCFLFFLFLFAVKWSISPSIGAKIKSFMYFFWDNWPDVKITRKLHIVEKHVVDFIAK